MLYGTHSIIYTIIIYRDFDKSNQFMNTLVLFKLLPHIGTHAF